MACASIWRAVDRQWGWIIVFGVSMSNMIMDGFLRGFGVFFTAFLQEFGGTASATAMIYGLRNATFIFLSPLAAGLGDRFSERALVMAGGVILSLAYVLNFFSPNLAYVIVVLGVVSGLGSVPIVTCLPTVIGKHFQIRRSLATTIGFAGSGLGQLLIPHLVIYLIELYGVRGMILIYGGIQLNNVVIGALIMPFEKLVRIRRLHGNSLDTDQALYKEITICADDKIQESYVNSTNYDTIQESCVDSTVDDTIQESCLDSTVDDTIQESFVDSTVDDTIQESFVDSTVDDTIQEHCVDSTIDDTIQESCIDSTVDDTIQESCIDSTVDESIQVSCIDSTADNTIQESCIGKTIHDKIKDSTVAASDISPVSDNCMLGSNSRAHSIRKCMDDFMVDDEREVMLKDINETTVVDCIGFDRHLQHNGIYPENKSRSAVNTTEHTETDSAKVAAACCVQTKCTSLCDFSLFLRPTSLLYFIATGIACAGFQCQTTFIVPRAMEIGISLNQAAIVLSISGGIDILGRLVMGVLADIKFIGPFRVMIVYTMIVGLANIALPACDSFSSMVGYAVVFGVFGSGGHILIAPTVVELEGREKLASGVGCAILMQGLAGAILPPLMGLIRDRTGSYAGVFYACACVQLFASATMVLVHYFHCKRHNLPLCSIKRWNRSDRKRSLDQTDV